MVINVQDSIQSQYQMAQKLILFFFFRSKFVQINRNENANSSLSQTKLITDLVTNNFTPSVTRIIGFAKMIPGFLNLDKDDQITLLKGGSLEVLLVRLAQVITVKDGMCALIEYHKVCIVWVLDLTAINHVSLLLFPDSLDNKGSWRILKDFYCSVTMRRELGLTLHKSKIKIFSLFSGILILENFTHLDLKRIIIFLLMPQQNKLKMSQVGLYIQSSKVGLCLHLQTSCQWCTGPLMKSRFYLHMGLFEENRACCSVTEVLSFI